MIGIWLRSGIAAVVGLRDVVDQAGDRERLPVAQLDFGFGATGLQRRNPESLERDAVVEVERAHFGPDLQADQVAGDRRREVEADAELLELNRDAVRAPGDDGDREFAAGEETGFLAVVGNQVWFGQALEVARSASGRESACRRSNWY